MNDIILTLLSMSVTGTLLSLLVMAAKKLFGSRLPSSLLYYIWLIVLLRMALPIGAEHSLLNELYTMLCQAARSSVSLDAVFATVSSEDGSIPLRVSFFERSSSTIMRFISDNAVWIWLSGAVIYLAHVFGSYAAYRRRLISSSSPASEGDNALLADMCADMRRAPGLLACARVQSPQLVGVLRPCIILPERGYVENGHETVLRNILLHELTHYRRGDLILKRIVSVVLALHWFNPFIHLMSHEISVSGELACDEGAVRDLDDEQRRSYGYTLIMTAAGIRFGAAVAAFANRKENLRERVLQVKGRKKLTAATAWLGMAVISVLLAASLAVGIIMPVQTDGTSPIEGISHDAYEQYIAIVDSLHYSDFESMQECFGSYAQFEEYFKEFLCYEGFVLGDVDSVGEECYNQALFAECCYRTVLCDYRIKQFEHQYGTAAAEYSRALSDSLWANVAIATTRQELQSLYTYAEQTALQTLRGTNMVYQY